MPRHWLMKSEPGAYSIDHLARDGSTTWEGVRNYQARNFMRDDMRPGDPVLFYHSNADPTGVAGLARVSRTGLPDPSALDPRSDYFDPRASEEDPRWMMVEIAFSEKFPAVVTLDDLRAAPGLEKMLVINKSRLSVQPVTPAEFDIVVKLGRRRQVDFRAESA
ncbi:MAG TPA: EVE domain-containing protein [Longimicrobiaceae bacterium]|nr:EVE domain-containing protein [Longimicrobiaceae bacterium]